MVANSINDPSGNCARPNSADGFEAIVRAHVDAVHSQCLRQLRDSAAAEDVTQMVFITLAKKGPGISAKTVMAGWLFMTAHYCCRNYQRAAARRRAAERKAALMRSEAIGSESADGDFAMQMEGLLDDALAQLGQRDRDAVLLRFFQGQSLREVGNALGVSEDAAKQRVCRAVERLRSYFVGRGVAVPSAGVAAFMGSVIKPAAPQIARAAIQAAAHCSAAAPIYGSGLLRISAWWKVVAPIAVAATVAAGVVIAGRNLSTQTQAAAATAAPDAPAPSPAVGQAPAATQPSSQATPVDALNKLCSAIEKDDRAAIDECLCDDGKDRIQAAVGRMFVENAACVYRIEQAWRDKFGVEMAVSGLGFDCFPGGTYQALFRGTMDAPGGPDAIIDGDVAKIRVALPPEAFMGSGPDRATSMGRWSGAMLVFDYIHGQWKLNTDRTFNFAITMYRMDGNTTDAMELESQFMVQMNHALDAIAGQIETGIIPTANRAATAVESRISKAFKETNVRGSSYMVFPVIGG